MFLKDPLGISDYHIPQMEVHHFYRHSEIDITMFNVPEKHNYMTIDSLAPHRGELFQITSSETHPIETSALIDLKSKFASWLRTNKTVKFIFVVPPSRFAHFTKQSYVGLSEKVTNEVIIDDGEGNEQEEKDVEGNDKAVKLTPSEDNQKESEEKLRKKKTREFDDSWIEQYVLEMDITPLTKAKFVGT